MSTSLKEYEKLKVSLGLIIDGYNYSYKTFSEISKLFTYRFKFRKCNA